MANLTTFFFLPSFRMVIKDRFYRLSHGDDMCLVSDNPVVDNDTGLMVVDIVPLHQPPPEMNGTDDVLILSGSLSGWYLAHWAKQTVFLSALDTVPVGSLSDHDIEEKLQDNDGYDEAEGLRLYPYRQELIMKNRHLSGDLLTRAHFVLEIMQFLAANYPDLIPGNEDAFRICSDRVFQGFQGMLANLLNPSEMAEFKSCQDKIRFNGQK